MARSFPHCSKHIVYRIIKRYITYDEIKQLSEAIEKPPYLLTPERIWQAYEQLERSRVRGAGAQKLLTNIISLIRFAIGKSEILEPFPDTVEQRFNNWLAGQESSGRKFTQEQISWLRMIKEHIGMSLRIDMEDFEYTPFQEKGGAIKVIRLFGNELGNILNELNEVLAA